MDKRGHLHTKNKKIGINPSLEMFSVTHNEKSFLKRCYFWRLGDSQGYTKKPLRKQYTRISQLDRVDVSQHILTKTYWVKSLG